MRPTVRLLALFAVLCAPAIARAADQPHMEAALQALLNARHEIEIADQYRDHGGHAGAATHLIEDAIRETREGIRYRNEHGR